jgi:saccharopine dehydrogenase-like NADP-dependent oxidoreductase
MIQASYFPSFALIGCGTMSFGLVHYMVSLGFQGVFLHDLEPLKVTSLLQKLQKSYPGLQIIKDPSKQNIDVTLLSCSGPATELFLRESSNHSILGKHRLVVSLGRPNYDELKAHQTFHQYLQDHHISLLMGFGIEPGLTEALAAYLVHSVESKQVQDLSIYCGGVPQKAQPPLYYNRLFGTQLPYLNRDSLWKVNNQVSRLPRFSLKEKVFVDNIGFFEAYHDGLSPYFLLEESIKKIPYVKQQTLRWPGFFDAIQLLSSLGLLDDQIVLKNGMTPATFTHTILERKGILRKNLYDISIIYIVMKLKDGCTRKFRLSAHYDPQTDLTGMSQLTCFTAAFSAKNLLENLTDRPGIHMSHSWFTNKRIMDFQKDILQLQPNSIVMEEYDYI